MFIFKFGALLIFFKTNNVIYKGKCNYKIYPHLKKQKNKTNGGTFLKFTIGDLFSGSGEYSVYLLLSAAQQGMQEPK
jgi:hypothetical protein